MALSPTMVLSVYPGGVPAFLDASKQPKGLKTGFITFDEMTQGLMPADLVIVAARPAMGKSAGSGMSLRMSATKGRPSLASWLR